MRLGQRHWPVSRILAVLHRHHPRWRASDRLPLPNRARVPLDPTMPVGLVPRALVLAHGVLSIGRLGAAGGRARATTARAPDPSKGGSLRNAPVCSLVLRRATLWTPSRDAR